MGIEQLTYLGIAERLNISAEAARALARRMRLPRQKANDGKTLVAVDFAEIQHKPSPMVRRADCDALEPAWLNWKHWSRKPKRLRRDSGRITSASVSAASGSRQKSSTCLRS